MSKFSPVRFALLGVLGCGAPASEIDTDSATSGSTGVVWDGQPDVWDDFERGGESEGIGRTPGGDIAWALEGGPMRPQLVGGALAYGPTHAQATASLGALAVEDFALSVRVAVGADASEVTAIGYHGESAALHELRITSDAVALYAGDTRIAGASWSFGEPVTLRLVVCGTTHAVFVADHRLLTVESPANVVAGPISLRGSDASFDDLWIRRLTDDGGSEGAEAEPGGGGGAAPGGGRAAGGAAGGGADARDENGPAGQGPPGPAGLGGAVAGAAGSGSSAVVVDDDTRARLAPVLDRTVPTSLWATARFLFEGPGAPQVGVAAGTIDPQTVALVHGRVVDDSGAPIAGVGVGVHGHPEFGSIATESDGSYDLAVRGGVPLTVVHEAPGFLSRVRRRGWVVRRERPHGRHVDVRLRRRPCRERSLDRCGSGHGVMGVRQRPPLDLRDRGRVRGGVGVRR